MATDEKQALPITYVTRNGGIDRHYINSIGVEVDNYCDVRIEGGQFIGGIETAGQVVIENRVEVTLTWLAFKTLIQLGQEKIAEYERRNGEIKLPLMADPLPSANAVNIQESTATQDDEINSLIEKPTAGTVH